MEEDNFSRGQSLPETDSEESHDLMVEVEEVTDKDTSFNWKEVERARGVVEKQPVRSRQIEIDKMIRERH